MSQSRHLRRRIRLVEELLSRATTTGEREAAARARDRLRARLEKLPADPHGPAAQMGPLPESHPGVALPDRGELTTVLRAWYHQRLSTVQVRRWAQWFVDKLVLPDVPVDDPNALLVEVLLQLASMERAPMWSGDAGEILAFLDLEPEDGVRAWLQWLGTLDWQARRTTPAGGALAE